MFDAFKAHAEFSIAIARLQINRVGTGLTGYAASPMELEAIGSYIEQVCKLTANHIEAIMADASASISAGRLDEADARAIADTGSDLVGQLARAAESIVTYERARMRA